MSDEYELRKEDKFNPDKKKSWKKHRTFKTKHQKQHLKLNKNDLMNDTFKKKKGVIRGKDHPYRDPSTEYKTLNYYRLKRSGIFCKKCDCKFCKHRITETVVNIILSYKKKNGDFSILPKDIVLMIAKKVYNVQKEHLRYVDSLPGTNPFNYGRMEEIQK